jgi:hypothetical protein
LFLVILAGFLFVQPHSSTASRNAMAAASFSNPSFDGPGGADAAPAGVQSAGVFIQYFEAYEITSGVSLTWMAISQNDIEGYRLYRKGEDDDFFALVNEDGLLPAWKMTFLDSEIAGDNTCQYVLGIVHQDRSEFLSNAIPVTPSRAVSPR